MHDQLLHGHRFTEQELVHLILKVLLLLFLVHATLSFARRGDAVLQRGQAVDCAQALALHSRCMRFHLLRCDLRSGALLQEGFDFVAQGGEASSISISRLLGAILPVDARLIDRPGWMIRIASLDLESALVRVQVITLLADALEDGLRLEFLALLALYASRRLGLLDQVLRLQCEPSCWAMLVRALPLLAPQAVALLECLPPVRAVQVDHCDTGDRACIWRRTLRRALLRGGGGGRGWR